MKDLAQKPPGAGGGSIATRGFLVQTLVALLDVVQANQNFSEITLEPAFGDEQFDFVWKDHAGTHATQVKSTTNSFTKAKAAKWAKKLEKARTTESCCLMLVGNIHPSLNGVKSVGAVVIETKNLHLGDLIEQAAQRLAKFLEGEKQNAGTASEREMIVRALVTQLQQYATESKTLSREAFIQLLRQWVTSAPRQEPSFDISRILKYAPEKLVGRDGELNLLNPAWSGDISSPITIQGSPFTFRCRPHILTFVALGGEGKTSLVAKWAVNEMNAKGWPGCDTAFAWSFYSQGTRDQLAADSDLFLKAALTFFGDKETAESSKGAFEKGRRLAQLCAERRSLLILDGLEPLQYAPTSPTPGELKDQGIAALLKALASNKCDGLCIVTTRYSLPDLRVFWQTTAPEVKLLRLPPDAGMHLLKDLGVIGTAREFATLVEDVRGHALTLNLLGTYLRDAHGGDIRKRDLVNFKEADAAHEHKHHAFHVMDAYVRWLSPTGFWAWIRRFFSQKERDTQAEGKRALTVLRLVGLFDRPVTDDCFGALLKSPAISNLTEPLVELSEAQRNTVLKRLEDAKLLTVNRDASGALVSLDAHPLIREYFAKQLREQGRAGSPLPAAGNEGERRARSDAPYQSAWRAAHRRLYEHLCKTTSDKKPNPTLEDLQPLYQAVAHGCQAGLQQEAREKVYRDRILRGAGYEGFYSTKKLGAFASDLGAVACFFEQPWSRVSPALTEVAQAWLLSQAAVCLRASGRLTEALEPMRAGVERADRLRDWKNAARNASNLSELELTLGEVAGAVAVAEQSVTYADRSGDAFLRMVFRTTHADALHQAGCRAEAETLFREAEQMQKERQTEYPLLYSLQGFRYCDLLLAAPECGAWQHCIAGVSPASSPGVPPGAHGGATPPELAAGTAALLSSCRAVSERAAQTLKWVTIENSLLDIALDHLTLGRAALYAAILEPSALEHITAAVAVLRRSGNMDDLPRGLLTRAWLRFLIGARTGPDSAQEDLDEAWEIAERGPMKLHLADIHLHRARLFFREAKYPWQSPAADLAAAGQLINTCGYHRRDQELADAQRAILGL